MFQKVLGIRDKLIRHGVMRAPLRSLANTVLNEMERKLGRGYLVSNPDIVHVEPTTACNLGCTMCGRSTYWKDLVRNSAHMKRETFMRLEPFLRSARLAALHGWGEPLLHPDFLWMVQVCKRAGCMVTFHTNGLLLTEKMARALIESRLDHITVSIDGASAESYRSARGADLEDLLSNLRCLRDIKERLGVRHPKLTFKCVVTRRNLHELPSLVEQAAECGARELELNNLVVYHPSLSDQTVFDLREEVETAHAETLRRAGPLGVRVFYGGVEEKDGVPACPFRSFTVTCDGTVGPCGAQRLAMGNIHDTPLRKLWNSASYVEMRLAYARRELPHQCEHCPGRTNRREDHVHPDLEYVEHTLGARQWERAQRNRPQDVLAVIHDKPSGGRASDARSGGCGSASASCRN
jgi:radical SAM protein with 4Fe4S-binding SPASM domain